MAKLNAKISSERQSRTVSKSSDRELVIDLTHKNANFGRVVLHSDINGTTCYFYPITEVMQKGGRTLLYEAKT